MSERDEPREQEQEPAVEKVEPGAGQPHPDPPNTATAEGEEDLDWEVLMDHEYDGIREYDNPLPGWWVWIFAATIVFAIFYTWYYHLGVGKSPAEKYEVALQEYRDWLASLAGEPITDERLMEAIQNPKILQQGEELFKNGQCVSCHGVNATGGVGPNLTDVYWKHVKEGLPTEITAVIRNGVQGDQGVMLMPSFAGQNAVGRKYTNDELVALTAYVASLYGKNREGKAPQGEKVEPQWPVSN